MTTDTDLSIASPAPADSDLEVLVLTRSRDLLTRVLAALKGRCGVRHAASASRAEQMVRTENIGVVITNALPDGLPRMLERLHAWNPSLTVIATGRREQGHDQALLELQSSGRIVRFMLEPLARGQLVLAVDAALRAYHERVHQAVEEVRHLRVDAREAVQTSRRNGALIPFSLAAMIFMASAGGLVLLGTHSDGQTAPYATATLDLDEDDRAVSRALIAARRAREEARFVAPEGDNAFFYYRQVLAVHPNHQEAASGINGLVNMMFAHAEASLRAGAFAAAREALGRARRIAPSHPRLSVLGAGIDAAEQGELLDQALAAARAARHDRAVELVEQAARLSNTDSARVREARRRIIDVREQIAEETRLTVTALDRALDASQLLPPWEPNARDSLQRLRALRADATLLRQYGERLQEALAARAEVAIEAGDFAAAARDIDGLAGMADTTIAAVRAEELEMALTAALQSRIDDPGERSARVRVRAAGASSAGTGEPRAIPAIHQAGSPR